MGVLQFQMVSGKSKKKRRPRSNTVPSNAVVSGVELGDLVRQLSFQRGETQSERARRIYFLHTSEEPPKGWDTFLDWFFSKSPELGTWSQEQFEQNANVNLGNLENRNFKNRKAYTGNILFEGVPHALAEIYRVTTLAFYPLLAKKTNDLTAECANDFNRPAEGQLGTSQYAFPNFRLKTCDAMVVWVTIQVDGESDLHWHSGDELLVVISGQVDVVFPNSGLDVSALSQGSYLHFNAEMSHVVRNSGAEAAQLFVIRFNQLSGGFRRQAHSAAEAILNRKAGSPDRGLLDTLKFWVRAELEEVERNPVGQGKTVHNLPDEIANPTGLAQFLRHVGIDYGLLKSQVGPTSEPLWTTPAAVQSLLGGKYDPAFGLKDLMALAKCKSGLLPELLFAYAFPRAAKLLAVRYKSDLRKVEGETQHNGVTYSLPCRMLLGTDTSVAFITLERDATTEINQHPGCEVVICFRGSALVSLPEEPGEPEVLVGSSPFKYAFFDSSKLHQIKNTATDSTELIIIRIYGYGYHQEEGIKEEPKRKRASRSRRLKPTASA